MRAFVHLTAAFLVLACEDARRPSTTLMPPGDAAPKDADATAADATAADADPPDADPADAEPADGVDARAGYYPATCDRCVRGEFCKQESVGSPNTICKLLFNHDTGTPCSMMSDCGEKETGCTSHGPYTPTCEQNRVLISCGDDPGFPHVCSGDICLSASVPFIQAFCPKRCFVNGDCPFGLECVEWEYAHDLPTQGPRYCGHSVCGCQDRANSFCSLEGCIAGATCDPGTGTGCPPNETCLGNGQYCSATHSCTTDQDCAAALMLCENGFCTKVNAGNSCPRNTVLGLSILEDPHRQGEHGCVVPGPQPTGAACEGPAECATGHCYDGKCVLPCTGRGGCPQGQECGRGPLAPQDDPFCWTEPRCNGECNICSAYRTCE